VTILMYLSDGRNKKHKEFWQKNFSWKIKRQVGNTEI